MFFMWPCQLRIGLCVSFMDSRGSVTHIRNLWSQVYQHWAGLRKQIHTSVERWGGQGRARKGELVHMAPSYLTWEVERYGPEPSMPVSGEEEGEQCWMKRTEKPSWKS